MTTRNVTLNSVDEFERIYFPLAYQEKLNTMKDNDGLGIAIDFLGEVQRQLPKSKPHSITHNRTR